jgi:UDPglucose 6-dehydrogenase
MPGDTERVKEILERSSGKRCGEDFGLCYSPEFIALGRVIDDLRNPDMVFIGQSDQRAGDLYESVVRQLTDNQPPVMRMNFINAELSKLAVNAYVTTKISYANMLARICERYVGADADVVTNAIGYDSRIGRKYLKGAVAFGGPCFPRDNLAFSKAAQRAGTEAPLADTTHRYNQAQTGFLLKIIREHLSPGSTVAVLGLAYKPDTPVVEESASLSFIFGLLEAGYSVRAYDPMAMDNAKRILGGRIAFAPSAVEAIRNSDLVAIMTPWDAFKGIKPDQLAGSEGRRLVLDAWRILTDPAFGEVAEVIQLGRGPEPKPMLETL